ncbi:MAG: Hsp70 family protein [Celeribacter sp.]|jgi:hypothetical chaperone protein
MPGPTLAIDFGTSNSAAAILEHGIPRRLLLEPQAETLPTAVFFPANRGPMRIGAAAAAALIDGEEGRYMRALKSVLGTALLHETRLIGGTRRSLAQVITEFLIEIRKRAEAASGTSFTRVLSGRPVHFHSADPVRDAQAEADLRACYHAAGFDTVDFLPEPEAAALANHAQTRDDTAPAETGLIVDIGGGTSDFTVFRVDDGQIRILASHGIRLGGTDFDHAVSMDHAMPLLGLGGQLHRSLGEGLLPVPKAIYVELSSWAKIPFLYTPDTRRMVADLVKHAEDRPAMERLATVIEDELGHELAFAVEAGKIAANNGAEQMQTVIDMSVIARGISAPVTPASLDASLSGFRAALRRTMQETLDHAGLTSAEVGRVVLVGGSSLMGMVAQESQALCPKATLHRSEAFTAVVDGLAVATAG